MNEGFDLTYEEDKKQETEVSIKKEILRILKNKKDWMNTLQITNKIKELKNVHYYTINKILTKLVREELVESFTVPYGKKREMELWRAV
ncbi:MAG: hypothetical protein ACOC1K_05950 [Nanoarchaeota archaeon]